MNSNIHYKSIRGNKDKSKQVSLTYATKSALYYGKYIKLNINFVLSQNDVTKNK